ncbi:hypothetical protein O6P43_008380 [Quillaja saponaria]|uniref:Uncharacterized protein n=1 Tax=Quillaja saponaria TaxID=32244 RepID=A0AAD7PW84_QUISA|nr:hypothetical protein O6P43_008380 [Quillaja saponaria]
MGIGSTAKLDARGNSNGKDDLWATLRDGGIFEFSMDEGEPKVLRTFGRNISSFREHVQLPSLEVVKRTILFTAGRLMIGGLHSI